MLEVRHLARAAVLASMVLSSHGIAQEFVPAAESAAAQQPMAVVPVDAGVQAVTEATAQPYVQEVPAEFISAEEQLADYLVGKNWSEGWDERKKRMFVIYSESFNVEDPSYDTDFISKRSLYATMAVMGAKAKIVEFMRTEMSATDQLTAPGTDVHEKLNQKYNQLIRKINKQQAELARILREVDAAEAAKLEGVSWEDLGREALIAAIKKLDSSFDAGKITEDKRQAFERARSRYEEALTGLEALEEQARTIQGKVKLESSSSVETLARAPLMGATLLAQAESWNAEDEEYQVAVLLVWSEKLEQAAESILAGRPQKTRPRQGKTVQEWARSQDLSTMVGSRQFIDKDGRRWFVGAYGSFLEGSSSAKRSAKGRADLFARKEAAVALFADLETQKQAQIAMQTRNAGLGGRDVTAVAESFAETTRQSIENRQVSGMSKLLSRTVKHPVSGHNLYVVLYGISADSAVSAMAAEARSYAKAIEAARNNIYQQGLKQGYDQQINSARNDRSSFQQGQQAAKAEISRQQVAKPASTEKAVPVNKAPSNSGPTQSQTVFSAPTIDDDDF